MNKWIIIGILLISLCSGTASAGLFLSVDDTPDPVFPGDFVNFKIQFQTPPSIVTKVTMTYDPTELVFFSSDRFYNVDQDAGSITMEGYSEYNVKMQVICAAPEVIDTFFTGFSISLQGGILEDGESESTTVMVVPQTNVPEFPSIAIPAILVVGLMAMVAVVRKK